LADLDGLAAGMTQVTSATAVRPRRRRVAAV